MAFLFNRNRQRSSPELCRNTRDLLQKASTQADLSPDVERDLARNLSQMKLTLQGTTEIEVSPQQVHQLVEYIAKEDILLPLALNLHKLSFEARKDTQVIFSAVLRFKSPHAPPDGSEPEPYILPHILDEQPDTIIALCNGYNYRESALFCGAILREAIKYDSIAALILYHEPSPPGQPSTGLQGVDPAEPASGAGVFWRFFNWIDKGLFEVNADAHNTFSELLKKHRRLVSTYILTNYDLFTTQFNTILLRSPSYVTQRTSIKLLGELLLDRTHFTFMTRYVSSAANLKLAMQLLKDERKMVSFEAFHVFKIFAANPNKTPEVLRILIMNKDRLLKFLPAFLSDRQENLQLQDEKAWIINQIHSLPSDPAAAFAASSAATASPTAAAQPSGATQSSAPNSSTSSTSAGDVNVGTSVRQGVPV